MGGRMSFARLGSLVSGGFTAFGSNQSSLGASIRILRLGKYGWGGRISFACGSLVSGGFAAYGSNTSSLGDPICFLLIGKYGWGGRIRTYA